VLRATGLAYKLEHASELERKLEQHGPDEATVTLSLTDGRRLSALLQLGAGSWGSPCRCSEATYLIKQFQ
jgi:Mg-chelatase subunit ChlD